MQMSLIVTFSQKMYLKIRVKGKRNFIISFSIRK